MELIIHDILWAIIAMCRLSRQYCFMSTMRYINEKSSLEGIVVCVIYFVCIVIYIYIYISTGTINMRTR